MFSREPSPFLKLKTRKSNLLQLNKHIDIPGEIKPACITVSQRIFFRAAWVAHMRIENYGLNIVWYNQLSIHQKVPIWIFLVAGKRHD